MAFADDVRQCYHVECQFQCLIDQKIILIFFCKSLIVLNMNAVARYRSLSNCTRGTELFHDTLILSNTLITNSNKWWVNIAEHCGQNNIEG